MNDLKLADLEKPVFDGPREPDAFVPHSGPSGCPEGPSTPTVALVTMTKNGWKRLEKLFESVKGFVSSAVILDTGSSDGTVEWLHRQSNPDFRIHIGEQPFVNFEVSRNQLMAFAKDKADWLLLLDDDMGLTFGGEFPSAKKHDILMSLNPSFAAYMLKHEPNPEYWMARLVRGDRLWTYKGVTHEYLEGGGPGNPKLEGVTVWHHFNHGMEKFTRDLILLTADIARDPNNSRTIFYLAGTLRDLGQTEAAIRFFCMRANMGGWQEEVFYSMYEAARLAKDPEGMKLAHAARPSRAEAAAWLSGYYKLVKPDIEQHKFWESIRAAVPSPVNEYLFVIPFCYGPEFISKLESYS